VGGAAATRAPDPRYLGLTPSQWSCLAAVAVALVLLAWIDRHREAPPARYLDPTPWRVDLRGLLPFARSRGPGDPQITSCCGRRTSWSSVE
jgi:hypothetical protein